MAGCGLASVYVGCCGWVEADVGGFRCVSRCRRVVSGCGLCVWVVGGWVGVGECRQV